MSVCSFLFFGGGTLCHSDHIYLYLHNNNMTITDLCKHMKGFSKRFLKGFPKSFHRTPQRATAMARCGATTRHDEHRNENS